MPSPAAASQPRPVVVVADPLAPEGLALLRERCDVRTPNLAPQLQIVGRAGVGIDNIDVAAATARGVYVVNAPTGNVHAAAEHALTLALSLMRSAAREITRSA